MDSQNFKRTKFACFYTYIAMAPIFVFPPLLFLTFRETYGISYTLLGSLILINFCTQLIVDLIFSFFSKYFNTRRIAMIMPLLTTLGLIIFSFFPTFFPSHAYSGLALGTVIFSIASGLNELLLSPIVAALPSENHERDLSLLHSLYAWGVVSIVLVTTLFFNLFGSQNWMYLGLFYSLLPLVSFFLFYTSPIPDFRISHSENPEKQKSKRLDITLCILCIFLGSCAEGVMTTWISGYIEMALNIPKSYGDILGMALFALLLGFGRTLYAKFGKNIFKTLLFGMITSAVCYLTVAFSPNVMLNLFACVLTGFCTSMLWPGTLILMEEKIPSPGIAAYALMASGGDLGISVAPQMMGIIVDKVSASTLANSLSQTFLLSPEQIGMKVGMLVTAIFPIMGIILLIGMKKYFDKKD